MVRSIFELVLWALRKLNDTCAPFKVRPLSSVSLRGPGKPKNPYLPNVGSHFRDFFTGVNGVIINLYLWSNLCTDECKLLWLTDIRQTNVDFLLSQWRHFLLKIWTAKPFLSCHLFPSDFGNVSFWHSSCLSLVLGMVRRACEGWRSVCGADASLIFYSIFFRAPSTLFLSISIRSSALFTSLLSSFWLLISQEKMSHGLVLQGFVFLKRFLLDVCWLSACRSPFSTFIPVRLENTAVLG